jgi:hypothetical protein
MECNSGHKWDGHGILRLISWTSPGNLHAELVLNAIMDVVRRCLSLTPVPCLVPHFSALKLICSAVEHIQVNQGQLEALAQSIAELLQALDGEYRAGKLLDVRDSTSLAGLDAFVRSMCFFAFDLYPHCAGYYVIF